jgi:DNA invertase Pin-like site-specific DNA recombinase
MRDLRPGMGARRSKAIGAALTAYAAPDRKLSFTKAEAIRAAYASGQSVSALAREYGVRRATIRPILKRESTESR